MLDDALRDPRREIIVDVQERLATPLQVRPPIRTRAVRESLRGTKLPVVVDSSYEQTRLTELAEIFPDLARPIRSVVRRLADLLPLVRGCVYHPDFDFSSSIKVVAPALCPDVTYADLEEIADGGAASTAFWLMASGRADAEMSARLERSLLAYCRRDTWALARLHQALKALAAPDCQ